MTLSFFMGDAEKIAECSEIETRGYTYERVADGIFVPKTRSFEGEKRSASCFYFDCSEFISECEREILEKAIILAVILMKNGSSNFDQRDLYGPQRALRFISNDDACLLVPFILGPSFKIPLGNGDGKNLSEKYMKFIGILKNVLAMDVERLWGMKADAVKNTYNEMYSPKPEPVPESEPVPAARGGVRAFFSRFFGS